MPTKFPFYLKLSSVLLSIILIVFILSIGQNILIPLAFGCLWTLILIGPCNYLERRHIPPGIAALIVLLLSIILILIVLYFISSQVVRFQNDLPVLVQQLQAGIAIIQQWLQQEFHISSDNIQNFLNTVTQEAMSHTSTLLSSTFATLSNVILYMVLIPIYTFLLLLYRKLIVRFLINSFAEQHGPRVRQVLDRTKYVIRSYLAGILIEMVIVAFMNCTAFFIIGVKYAFLLGVIAAILNLIPYLGIFTAGVLSILITFTTNEPVVALGVAIILIIVHAIDSNILLPKIVGSKVKLNALVTIVGVVVGSSLWGIPGMFLAVPIMAILKVIFDSVDDLKPWGLLLSDDHKPALHNKRWQVALKRRIVKMRLKKKDNRPPR